MGLEGPFGPLPVDLVRKILVAVYGDNGAALLSLASVCRLFRDCAHQILALQHFLDLRPVALQQQSHTPLSAKRMSNLRNAQRQLRNAALRRCHQLHFIDLCGAHQYATDSTLETICQNARTLESLLLRGCQALTQAGLAHLTAASCPLLKVLDLNACVHIGDASCLAGLPSLTHLDVGWCRQVSADSMAAVMPQLEHAVYHGCEAIEDWLLGTACCVRLLDCAFTPIGDRGLQLLAQVAQNLQELILAAPAHNLWLSGNWTPLGLETFKQQQPSVKVRLVFV
ncbi:hypothetical protein WJX84_007205 [Apatococcus fuscideae]|uniref:Uncharacterized protein n=1 Tax=Apatococcus fuscideae TaxID=2026836 RepID=A0AAW1SML1_9CHLO